MQMSRVSNDLSCAQKDKSCHLLESFETVLRDHASCTAVVTPQKSLSYRDFGETVEGLSEQLQQAGVKAGDTVCLQIQKGWEQLAALFAVMHLNAAFVPLSPDWPTQRLATTIQKVQPRLVATIDSLQKSRALTYFDSVICLDCDLRRTYRPTPNLDGNRLAYIIFTSGTTGNAKGVMNRHLGVDNTIRSLNEKLKCLPGDVWLSLSEITFDFSLLDAFCALTSGSTLAIATADILKDPYRLWQFARKTDVSFMSGVPALLKVFLDYLDDTPQDCNRLPAIRTFVSGGDYVPTSFVQQVERYFKKARIFSVGGVTEVSICTTYQWADEALAGLASVPYGRALANQSVRILDHNLECCKPEQTGEIYLGGIGLGLGYLNDPEKTAAAFIRHPRTGEELYKTGDFGRELSDGSIEFLGRDTGYIKLNGLRIELGEIENLLTQFPDVKDAVALVHANAIHAFICSSSELPPLSVIREHLGKMLPDYMLPQAIHAVSRIPLTTHGKVDRQALTDQLRSRSSTSSANVSAALTASQLHLKTLYEKVLGVSVNDIHQGFVNLGGNSIQAIRLITLIRAYCGLSLTVPVLLSDGSIACVSSLIELHQTHETSSLSDQNIIEI